MTLRYLRFLIVLAIPACARETRPSNSATNRLVDWLADSTCLFERTQTHPDPAELASQFVARDAAGAFLRTDAWFNGATTCPGHEPGYDSHDVIAGYRLQPLVRTDTVSQYIVQYAGLGGMEYRQDSLNAPFQAVWRPRVHEFAETLTVVRTNYGWRVRSPALWQHVLADSVLHRHLKIFPPRDSQHMQQVLDSLRARGWRGGA